MTTNRYKYFRWTGRTARISVMYAIVVPSMFIYMALKTDVSLDVTPFQQHTLERWLGLRRGYTGIIVL